MRKRIQLAGAGLLAIAIVTLATENRASAQNYRLSTQRFGLQNGNAFCPSSGFGYRVNRPSYGYGVGPNYGYGLNYGVGTYRSYRPNINQYPSRHFLDYYGPSVAPRGNRFDYHPGHHHLHRGRSFHH